MTKHRAQKKAGSVADRDRRRQDGGKPFVCLYDTTPQQQSQPTHIAQIMSELLAACGFVDAAQICARKAVRYG